MTLKNAAPTPAQEVCLSAALVGLVGSATEGLRRLPQDEALRIVDAVADGSASYVWTVEAVGDVATVKLELAHVSGPRALLAMHTVSLILGEAHGVSH